MTAQPSLLSEPVPAHAPRPASAALTKAGGYLAGYTHTLQPYIGCRFGCVYCYVAGSPVHLFHKPPLAWGDYAHPRPGIHTRLERELARFHRRGQLDTLSIFMSSSTDPYQSLERSWHLTRRCLEVFARYPPGLLVVQTRSPLVESDFQLLAALGPRLWLSLTIETDRDDVRRALTPTCPAIERRLETAARARAAGIQMQIAVSPCMPYSDPVAFGDRLRSLAQRVVVDTWTSGDGRAGRRTAASDLPARYAALGFGDWRNEADAHALHDYLQPFLGENLGWSQAGFTALTTGT